MIQVLVNTGRTIMQGMYVDHKNSRDYMRETAVIRLHPVDMMKLMLDDGEHVRATVHEGERDVSVVLAAYTDEGIVPGNAFIPLGPYANYLVPGDTSSTGMPHFKSTVVDVIAIDVPILTVSELMATCGGTPYHGGKL
ncbi:MAG: molybdopterin dinucleotide-binding protein [Methanomicrobiales archaeon]|jgi:formylmethanofuran dehydrogenase subunit D|nr:molybdopterin dinucleotide-binding protein [Methanomicrobiales archaeon]